MMSEMRVEMSWPVAFSRAHWRSYDYDDVQDSLDELAWILAQDHNPLVLSFAPPLIPDISFPRLWQRVVSLLEAHDFDGVLKVNVPSATLASSFERYLPVALRSRRVYDHGEMKVIVTVGDLSQASADAIVNASNRRLELGGGVSHALGVRFGVGLQHQMWATTRLIEHGEGVTTTHDGALGVRAIYHVASAQGSPETIARCVNTVFEFACSRGDRHLILPALGTGTGGLSMADFATVFYREAITSRFDGLCELWCWNKRDFNLVCQSIDAQMI